MNKNHKYYQLEHEDIFSNLRQCTFNQKECGMDST